jgi:glycine/D-amino acid oxidase-like deaminating enzyme
MKQITELTDDCLWHATAPEPPPLERLGEDLDVDCAIVGGGYTGLVTALRLAERGCEVALVEAREVGFGGSGRNLGHCTPTFHFWSLPMIKRMYGATYAERVIRMQTGAADQVFSLIEQYQIPCEAVRSGYLRVAGNHRDLATLSGLKELYGRYGLHSQVLDAKQAADLTGSPRFPGGWLLEGAGHLNPLAYARGLASAALSQGARIFTDSPAEGVERDGGRWRIQIPGGSLRANKVLMATGAYTIGPPWPKLDTAFKKVGVVGMASAPLDPKLRTKILKGDHSLVSTHGDPIFYKWSKQNRLVTSVRCSGDLGNDADTTRAFMTEKTKWVFPELGDVEWEHYWFGLLDAQYRTVPRIFRLDDNVYSCLGYSGRGVPTATAAGAELADLLDGKEPESLSLPVEDFKRVTPGLGLMHEANMAWGRIRDHLRLRLDGTPEPPPTF